MASDPLHDRTPDKDEPIKKRLSLDGEYEKILLESFVIIQKPGEDIEKSASLMVTSLSHLSPKTAYGISAKVTRLNLDSPWYDKITMATVRGTAVLAQSEELTLAEEPILDENNVVEDISGQTLELDSLYDGIESGRWIIVTGERTDIPGTEGVTASELAMVTGVTHSANPELPGDTPHTTLTLFKELAYRYKRDTVIINANVVKARHGETRTETLGSGDGSKPLQQFALKQSPLTHVSASTERGTSSTLQVRVNDILWREAESLEGLTSADRKYVTATDDGEKTTVTFGNGRQGRRLPTGSENVKAVYRTGIGKPGNVKAGSITLLATRPANVKSVNNPIRASGGADPETRDQARISTPLVTIALDRLVSVQDYADYARTFAGIGKADSRIVTDGIRRLVRLTIAGAGDIPIDKTSDLFRNLETALAKYGDPYQPVIIGVRELVAIVIAADVKLLPEYSWEKTEPKIRTALLDAFSFEQRELGQSVYKSEVVRVIMSIPGVDRCEIKKFETWSEADLLKIIDTAKPEPKAAGTEITVKPAPGGKGPHQCPAINVELARFDKDATSTGNEILPAQIACLVPDVPDVLVLNEVKE